MTSTNIERELPRAADLYGDLEPTPKSNFRDYVPGLLVAAVATLAAGFLAQRYAAPITLLALLVGLAMNSVGTDARLRPGLTFSSRTLLRIGIVLVGFRVTPAQIMEIGPDGLLAIVAIAALVMVTGVLSSRLLGYGSAFGALAGGAVAICGASAAMALATSLGERRISQAQLTLVLVGTSAMSSLAMVLYPILSYYAGFSDSAAGFIMGASIHDVAQSLGAGYAVSRHAGEVAAIVKLTRVALLAPVLGIVAMAFPRPEGAQAGKLGDMWFIFGFFLMMGLNAAHLVPAGLGRAATDLSTVLLACAVTATAMRSPMNALLNSGLRPLWVTMISSLVSLVLAALAAAFLIS